MKHFLVLIALLMGFQAFAQEYVPKKKLAVYMTGDSVMKKQQKVIGSKLVGFITRSDMYEAVERTEEFLKEITKENDYQLNEVKDSQIAAIGQKFGVRYVVVGEVSKVFDTDIFVSARLINVETGKIEATSDASYTDNNMRELLAASEALSEGLLNAGSGSSQSHGYVSGNSGGSGGSGSRNSGSTTLGPIIAGPGRLNGVIDSNEVIECMPEYEELNSRIRKLTASKESEFERLTRNYQVKMDEYQNLDYYTPASIKERRLMELQELSNNIEKFKSDSSDEMQKMQSEGMEPIRQKLLHLIALVASEKGVGIVFEKNSPVYVGKSVINLTEAVKNRL